TMSYGDWSSDVCSSDLGFASGVLVLDLRPTREPGTHEMTQPVERDLVRELGDHLRLFRTRADDRKVAAQDVEHLRELIEVRRARSEGRRVGKECRSQRC